MTLKNESESPAQRPFFSVQNSELPIISAFLSRCPPYSFVFMHLYKNKLDLLAKKA
jgi:hypothetical protein